MLLTPSDRRHVSQTVELIEVREHYLYLTQVLEENLVSSERIRQLVSGNAAISVQSTLNGYLGQVKVVLPDLNQFDRLRAMAAFGGSQ